jgi:hypothetical protein
MNHLSKLHEMLQSIYLFGRKETLMEFYSPSSTMNFGPYVFVEDT